MSQPASNPASMRPLLFGSGNKDTSLTTQTFLKLQ